jgi:hypothetical protein
MFGSRSLSVALLVVFAVCTLTGCGSTKKDKEGKAPVPADQVVVVLYDNTRSQTTEQRQACANYAQAIVEDVPGDSHVMLVPFSNEREAADLSAIYNDMADDPTKLTPAFEELVGHPNPDPKSGTFYAAPIQLLYEETRKTKLPVIGIMVSDGVFDDKEETPAAIRTLSRAKNLKLFCIVPVKYQYRSRVERALKPLGDKRWLVRTALDIEGGLDEIRARLK